MSLPFSSFEVLSVLVFCSWLITSPLPSGSSRRVAGHVWDMLAKHLVAPRHISSSFQEWETALREAWKCLKAHLIQILAESMGKRCASCMAARDSHVLY
ncbi:hypothetical protein AVEN_235461-1 [Araneus ventricosus]|uniref:Secreted protein n=1 Tax=Araneus ventricosus TaxID=182803 RepID=A0A4Y2A5M2_ARAVE|nr:hypothetical protein AVEN_235461-1 [Araneus ventricosus]